MATSHVACPEKRRSMRIEKNIILTVTAMDGGRGRYVEKVTTLAVSCHGCRYRVKHKPAVGELVLLELKTDRDFIDSAQARVRWLKETVLGTERVWEVAAELERPGNFWGVASPPEDWLSPSANNVIAQELQIVPRPQQQFASGPSRGNTQDVLGPMSESLAPLVASISDHVQKLVSETVMTAVAKEHANFVEQFHAQLHGEMTNTLKRVTAHCKEQLIRSSVSELTEALEASARKTQEHFINELEEGLKSAAIRLTAQVAQVNEQISTVANSAVERLKVTTEEFDREALDRFRVRSLDLCGQAENVMQQSMQRLTAQVDEFSLKSKNQFESNLNERLTRAECEMDQKSTAVVDGCHLALVKLSMASQESAQGELKTLMTAAAEQLAKIMNEQAIEISKQAFNQLQVSTRRFLESISGSIAEISTTTG